MLHFEWDPHKSAENLRKHKVSFEEAQTVFYDDFGLLIPDPDHSIGEERFILIGTSATTGICIVSHCYKDKGNVIRLISARKANKKEKDQYRSQYEG
ncbi:BrnT family toxin [Turneriella parva]|uniref:BrnT family toxin n=1 Tax=Turneriella parva (strain ATCC BAA-1111 / DSM 21527 / NCTC 11395 / H) TaxID=869212 RepID=I4B512_TURPD|nr:protein of unknown function DUF497 [Turneriella parva DSM 21527]